MTETPIVQTLVHPGGVVPPGGWADFAHDVFILGDGLQVCTRTLIDAPPPPPSVVPTGTIGWRQEEDGSVTLGASARLGLLSARIAQILDAIEAPVTIAPGGVLLIHGLEESAAEQVVRVLAPLGLIFDADSPLLNVTACVSCDLSLSDVHADGLRVGVDKRTHFSGCAARCGAPAGEHTEYVAVGDGEYDVNEASGAR